MAEPTTLEEAIAAIVALQNKFAEQHPDEACPPEECVAKEQVTTGQYLAASDPDTDCIVTLASKTGNAIPVVEGSTVENHDGSEADPIQLDVLWPIEGDFAGLLALQSDGTFRHWTPLPSDARHKLTTTGGTISQTLDKTYNEFVSTDIEEVCCKDMVYVIGGVQTVNSNGVTVIKLVRIPRQTFISCVCQNCNVESYDQVWNII